MQTQTVWKVLRRRNKKLFSFATNGLESDMRVRYFTNKVNTPRKGQNPFLFCFDSLYNAQMLAGNSPQNVIYEATATGVTFVNRCTNRSFIRASQYSRGTVFAKSVKLTKRVKR